MKPDTDSPVFLVSTERSGSNLVRLILNTHPKLTAPHPFEAAFPGKLDQVDILNDNFLRDVMLAKQYSHHPLETPLSPSRLKDRIPSEGPNVLRLQDGIYGEYVDKVDASRWVSKDPSVWEYLDDAVEYYKDPKFVYLVRDARDVSLSFKNSHVAGTHHPYYAAKRWQREQETGLEFISRHGDRVHVLRYKDLLNQPEEEVDDICDFLNVEYYPEMMYYYDTDEAVSTEESSRTFSNLSNPIMSDNYDKYLDQLPSDELKAVEKLAGDEMEEFGYTLEYSERDLETFEIFEDVCEEKEEVLTRKRRREYWKNDPREQMKRWMFRNFKFYMKIRYASRIG